MVFLQRRAEETEALVRVSISKRAVFCCSLVSVCRRGSEPCQSGGQGEFPLIPEL